MLHGPAENIDCVCALVEKLNEIVLEWRREVATATEYLTDNNWWS
jgi:hypothetical protein